MMEQHILPLDAAWLVVDYLGPIIWWTKALAGVIISACIVLLPKPLVRADETSDGVSRAEWVLVMYSRVGIVMGGLLLLLSTITPINAFGPLGDFIFFPAMATNLLCLIWCRRRSVFALWRLQAAPEYVVARSLIAGRASRGP